MYIVASLIVLAMALGAVSSVLDTVIDTLGLGAIRSIPVLGGHLDVAISIGMIWLLDISVVERFTGGMRSDWMGVVVNGAVIVACIPLKDKVLEAVGKGFARG